VTNRPLLIAALALCCGLAWADAAGPRDFAWHAPIELPTGAGVARVALPAGALMQLQSSDARDLRVFNAAGEPVAFAFMAAPGAAQPPRTKTRSYAALPLYSGTAGGSRAKGSMQVRIADASGGRSVWVQMEGAPAVDAPRLNSVLFDTTAERQPVTGLELQATLPANTPVWITASTSADLTQWTPLAVRGRVYRFEGDGAPANLILELDQAVQLERRYLRLDWDGQPGVAVQGLAGLVAGAAKLAERPRGELPPAQPASGNAIEIDTGFRTPIAALSLATPQDNTLLPVRVLGRNDVSQPWRPLAQTVVYRLSTGPQASSNAPLELRGASARWLRVESTNGANLAAAHLSASAEFEPAQLVFVATGAAPFELAAGHANAAPLALPLATIASTLGADRRPQDLPLASVGAGVVQAPDTGFAARLLPGAPGKTTLLWAVLVAGVLLLGGVAWSLMRQLKNQPPS
jgi:hypothetical protein